MNDTIKFGRQYLSTPTPAKVEFRLKVYVIVMALIAAYIQTASYIPALPKEITTGLINLTIAIASALAPLFGTNLKEGDVPIENVKVIETEPKPKADEPES